MADAIAPIAAENGFPWVFKASFDKANRTSLHGYRGPGLMEGLQILGGLRKTAAFPILTDIHDPAQAGPAAEIADILQIPAFLCRQTDLLLEAGRTGQHRQCEKGPVCGAARHPPRSRQGSIDGKQQGGADGARVVVRLQQPGGRHARAADDGGRRMAGAVRRHAQRAAAERRRRKVGWTAAVHRIAGARGGGGRRSGGFC